MFSRLAIAAQLAQPFRQLITHVEETSSDGSVHALPLSMFDPQYYQPLKMSVQKSR